jgi:hypothetical protein
MQAQGRAMSAIANERPVLRGRPSADTQLPEVHAELLALIGAHDAEADQPLPWPLLLRYVDLVAFDGPGDLVLDDAVRHRNPTRLIASILGDLSDYGLVEVGRAGLTVTSAGVEALALSGRDDLVEQMTKWLHSHAERLQALSQSR